MLKNFFNQPNALGRLVIVLLLAGGVVFAGAFNGFVVQTQASSCCGSGTDVFSSSENNEEDGCSCISDTYCGECDDSSGCSGSKQQYCITGCSCEECTSGTTVCENANDRVCDEICGS